MTGTAPAPATPATPATPAAHEALRAALARATDTAYVDVGPGAVAGVGETFRRAFGSRRAVVVADETTYAVAGEAATRALRAEGAPLEAAHVFPATPALHADYHHVEWLRDRLAGHDAIPVAIGAGTVNDLTKLAAHLAGRRSMVVATAASMDGYAAYGAAITRDGFKQTMACPAPRAVVADTTILAAAPAALTAAGFGDLAGKVTAGADWLVADALGVEPIEPEIWQLVQPAVRAALGAPERLPAGDPAAVEALFRCLTMSGLAMQAARSSRPASGAEHQLSHLWEMQGLAVDGREVSHGFKVGVGTVLVAALYERLLATDMAALDVDALCRAWPSLEMQEAVVQNTLGAHERGSVVLEPALVEVRAKYVTPDALRTRLERLREVWPALRRRLAAQLLPAATLRALLAAAGCPVEPQAIGLDRAAATRALPAARLIRRRYTVLDLAGEVGVLPW